MARQFKRFVQFGKLDDDLREVWGDATVEEVDAQDEIVRFKAAKEAFTENEDYFHKASKGKSKGNVRAMHLPIAAGRVIAWEADEKRKAIPIGTKIDDDAEWAKCKAGTYIGFSIAGNVIEEHREKIDGKLVNVIDRFKLTEVSLVDHPACASAVFSIVKLDRSENAEAIRKAMAEAAAATGTPAEGSNADVIRKTLEAAGGTPDPTPDPPEDEPEDEPEESDEEEVQKAARPKLDDVLKRLTPDAAQEAATIQALLFAKGFGAEKAKAWAKEHGFKNGKVQEVDGVLQFEQRAPEEFEGETATFDLAEGVKVVVGRPKVSTPRFAKFLKALMPSFRKAGSEWSSIVPLLCALRDLQNAMDSEAYSMMAGGDAAQEKADIGIMHSCVEALLEVIGNEFAEEVASWTSAGGQGQAVPFAYLDRLTSLSKALSPLQLRKMLDDGQMKENLDAIHRMGHGLVKASALMGSACPDGDCSKIDGEGKDPAAEEQDEEEVRDDAPSGDEGGEPDDSGAGGEVEEEEDEEKKPVKGKSKAIPSAVRTISDRGVDKLVSEIRKVGREVQSVKDSTKALGDRVERVEKLPAPIGRTPAAPATKSLATPTPALSPAGEILATLKDAVTKEQDPNKKRELSLFLTAQTIKLQEAGIPVE